MRRGVVALACPRASGAWAAWLGVGALATGLLATAAKGLVLAKIIGSRPLAMPATKPEPDLREAKSAQLAKTAEIAKAAATIVKPTSSAAKANRRSCSQGTTNSSKLVISLA